MAHRHGSMRLGMPLQSANQKHIEQTWAELKAAFILIQEQRFSADKSYQELYRLGYNLAIANQTNLLYNGLKDVVISHLVIVLEDIRALQSENLLAGVVEAYRCHHQSMLRIRDVLLYMDSKREKDKGQRPVYDLGMALFVTNILYDDDIRNRMSHDLLRRIEWIRKSGGSVDEPILKTVTTMLLELGLALPANHREPYERVFEADFFAAAALYYRRIAHSSICTDTTNDCVAYLKAAEAHVAGEAELVHLCLDEGSKSKLHQIIHDELLGAHKTEIIGNLDIHDMMEREKYTDIARLFRLFRPVKGGLDMISSRVAAHITAVCTASLQAEDQADGSGDDASHGATKQKDGSQDAQHARKAGGAKSNPVKLISTITLLMQQYHNMLQGALNNDSHFMHIVNVSFAEVINKHDRIAEYVSIYIDHLLRAHAKESSSSASPASTAFKDVDTALDYAIKLFRLMTEKDVFERYYKQYVLLHVAISVIYPVMNTNEAIRVISLLKAECGHHFTFRFEGMFKDIQLSNDNMKLFLAAHKERFKKTRSAISASCTTTTPSTDKTLTLAAGDANTEASVVPGATDTEQTRAIVDDKTTPSAVDVSTDAPAPHKATDNDLALVTVGGKTAAIDDSMPEHDTDGSTDAPLIELDVRVLATVMWPTQTPGTCQLPTELQRAADVYKAWYVGKHKGRNLTWQTSLGSVVLQAHFTGHAPQTDPPPEMPPQATPCSKILHVSTQQGVVLLQFDSLTAATPRDGTRVLTFAQLQTATRLEAVDLTRALTSLSMGKHRVLVRTGTDNPKSPVNADDVFCYNDAFTSKLTKIKISQGVTKESAPERKATRQRVDEDRRSQIDACVVRVMKGRRTMLHQDLVLEVTQQLSARFVPTAQSLKQRIGRLIENEYLERSADNP